jgi:hypothetical protein
VLFLAVLAVCLELLADMVVLKEGCLLGGRVLRDDGETLALGYRYGTLTLSKNFVERVVQVQHLSEYGRQLLPPTDGELLKLEEMVVQAASPADRPSRRPALAGRHAALTRRFRTGRHVLRKGGWELSLELPATFASSTKEDVLVLSSPGGRPGASICVAVVDTPPVGLAKQAELTEAAASSQLSGFSTVYTLTRQAPEDKVGECVLLGTCGPGNNPIITHTILRRTATHTFVLSFSLPRRLYEEYRPVFSICQDSIRLRQTGK